jgi:hypothetical protein
MARRGRDTPRSGWVQAARQPLVLFRNPGQGYSVPESNSTGHLSGEYQLKNLFIKQAIFTLRARTEKG